MCVAFFLYDVLPEYILLLAFNRDEAADRPTKTSHFWEDYLGYPQIVGGRDCEAGGTWLCVGTNGRVAFLTNFRENPMLSLSMKGNVPSRGSLPVQFVASTTPPQQYLHQVQQQEYAGYNLVVADLHPHLSTSTSITNTTNNGNTNLPNNDNNNTSTTTATTSTTNMMYFSNRTHTEPQPVQPGLHGVTNGPLDASWPKINHGKKLFQHLVDSGRLNGDTVPWENVFEIMTESEPLIEDFEQLPKTGYGENFEHKASAIFVKLFATQWGGHFGTRSQTVLAVKRDGRAELRERYLEGGEWFEKSIEFTMQIDSSSSVFGTATKK